MRTIKEICNGELLEELEIKAALSFKIFRLRILGREDHPDFQAEIAVLFENYYMIVIELPRGHGKSQEILDYLAWKCYYNRNLQILFISHGKDGATDNLQRFTDMIEENELLRQKLAPEDRKYSWSKSEIKTKTGCLIKAKANNRRVKGGHYNYVFADEIAEYTDKANYSEVVEPTVNLKKGKILCAGTPTSDFDLLADLKKDPTYANFSAPAILDQGTPEERPLWPRMFSLQVPEDLKKPVIIEDGIPKKSLPAIRAGFEAKHKLSKWMSEYMLKAVSDEAAVFPDELIKGMIDEREEFEDNNDNRFIFYMGADFAMSGASAADYNAWYMAKELTANKIKVVNIFWKKGLEDRTKDECINFYHRYNTKKAAIDNSSFGRVFEKQFEKEKMNVEGYDFKSKGKTRDELLQTLKDALIDRRIIVPYPKNDSRKLTVDELISQLRSFKEEYDEQKRELVWNCTARHDDLVIGLALLAKASERLASNAWFGFADI